MSPLKILKAVGLWSRILHCWVVDGVIVDMAELTWGSGTIRSVRRQWCGTVGYWRLGVAVGLIIDRMSVRILVHGKPATGGWVSTTRRGHRDLATKGDLARASSIVRGRVPTVATLALRSMDLVLNATMIRSLTDGRK